MSYVSTAYRTIGCCERKRTGGAPYLSPGSFSAWHSRSSCCNSIAERFGCAGVPPWRSTAGRHAAAAHPQESGPRTTARHSNSRAALNCRFDRRELPGCPWYRDGHRQPAGRATKGPWIRKHVPSHAPGPGHETVGVQNRYYERSMPAVVASTATASWR